MSHAGNWPRNPRKMALEIARQREREAAERPVAREVIFEASNPELLTLHPCKAAQQRFHVVARCTCGAVKNVDKATYLTTHLAHAPWPRVMRHMKCEACGGQPIELAFSLPVGQVDRLVPAGTIRVRLA